MSGITNQGDCYTEEEKAFYNACWECRHDFGEWNKPTYSIPIPTPN